MVDANCRYPTVLAALLTLFGACGGDDAPDADSAAETDVDSETSATGETSAEGNAYLDALLDAAWADDIEISIGQDDVTFGSDGYPNHDVLEAYALMGGTDTAGVVPSDVTFTIPLQPTWSDEVTETGLGTIGLAISGAVYFNPYEGDGVSVALDNNFDVGGIPFLDPCSGHPLPDETQYHYHGVPYCITDEVDTPGEHSVIIGVLLDGYPVYGPLGEDGDAAADLDECNGHDGITPEFPDGIYHYHITEVSPYIMSCYHGEVDASSGMMPRGEHDPTQPAALPDRVRRARRLRCRSGHDVGDRFGCEH